MTRLIELLERAFWFWVRWKLGIVSADDLATATGGDYLLVADVQDRLGDQDAMR